VLYLALNVTVLAVVPWRPLVAMRDLGERQAFIAYLMQTAYGSALAGRIAAGLVMVAAFASVFSLLLGYSRIPFAAARDGNFFRALGKLHRRGFPAVSLLWLGGAAAVFCFFSLAEVIAGLVVLRILVQFLAQTVGVMWMRGQQPARPRPFRLWLYPLPPLLALAGFVYILVQRVNSGQQLLMALAVVVVGTLVYWLRAMKPLPARSDAGKISR
jgi:amino acid transporter